MNLVQYAIWIYDDFRFKVMDPETGVAYFDTILCIPWCITEGVTTYTHLQV